MQPFLTYFGLLLFFVCALCVRCRRVIPLSGVELIWFYSSFGTRRLSVTFSNYISPYYYYYYYYAAFNAPCVGHKADESFLLRCFSLARNVRTFIRKSKRNIAMITIKELGFPNSESDRFTTGGRIQTSNRCTKLIWNSIISDQPWGGTVSVSSADVELRCECCCWVFHLLMSAMMPSSVFWHRPTSSLSTVPTSHTPFV